MAKSKTEKNLSRTIDKWDELYNKELLEPIFNHIRKNKDKYFVAFRNGGITVYYKKRVLIALKPKSIDEWKIYKREKFTTESDKFKQKFDDINTTFKEYLDRIKFSNGERIDLQDFKKYEKLIDKTKDIIDEYLEVRFKGKEVEETIQCDLACKYQDNDDLLCIDTEYAQSHKNQKEKDDSDIEGRYDFIFLKRKDGTDKYKLIFVELKSAKSACTHRTSGIINHCSDMEIYLDNYNEKGKVKSIMDEGVRFAVKAKKDLGLIQSSINVDFDDKPEFWILFKMVEGEKRVITIDDVEKLIKDEINSAKRTKKETDIETMKKKRIKVGNKKIPKYELENYPIDSVKFYYDDFTNNIA